MSPPNEGELSKEKIERRVKKLEKRAKKAEKKARKEAKRLERRRTDSNSDYDRDDRYRDRVMTQRSQSNPTVQMKTYIMIAQESI